MPDNKFFANHHNTWGHKWGYKDSSFVLNDDQTVSMVGDRYELSGTRMPDFIPYIEEVLSITLELIQMAAAHDVCLVPFGGGTNVTSALMIPDAEQRMIISVDMRRMDQIEWLNEEDRRVCVQAGITGSALESWLEDRGYCMGHEPDSVELSTLGGWIATNASGMKKNRYGNIEDIVENVTMISPKGSIEQVEPLSRASIGFKPQNILFKLLV